MFHIYKNYTEVESELKLKTVLEVILSMYPTNYFKILIYYSALIFKFFIL